MSLSRVKTWISGEVLTASDLNAEFNNVLTNSASLVFPVSGNMTWQSGTGSTGTLDHAITGDRTWVFPDRSSTVATLGGDQTFTGSNNFSVTQYLNDTANANMTLGLTLNQGANDDEILALKSSDVAHGMTDGTETDTFGNAGKVSATAGGLFVHGYTEDTIALGLEGRATNANTTKSTAGTAALMLTARKKSGTGFATMGADANLAAISDNGTTRFLFDAEGSGHSDVEWTTFDKFNDVLVLEGLDVEMRRRSGIEAAFGEWVSEVRTTLQKEGIVNFYDDGPRAMFNWTKMHMLEVGAIRQLARELKEARDEIEKLWGMRCLPKP